MPNSQQYISPNPDAHTFSQARGVCLRKLALYVRKIIAVVYKTLGRWNSAHVRDRVACVRRPTRPCAGANVFSTCLHSSLDCASASVRVVHKSTNVKTRPGAPRWRCLRTVRSAQGKRENIRRRRAQVARVGMSDDPRPKAAARWPTHLLVDGRRQSHGAQRGWRSCHSSGTAAPTMEMGDTRWWRGRQRGGNEGGVG